MTPERTGTPPRPRVFFLCHRPSAAQLDFYATFTAAGFDVLVVVDDNGWRIDPPAGVTLVYVSEADCVAAGYVDFNPAVVKPSRCSAWDKAIYHLTRHPVPGGVWLIEDDVFLASAEVLRDVDQRYRGIDIVSAENVMHRDPHDPVWPWLRYMPRQLLPGPWAHSMVCAVRLDDAVLRLVGDFIGAHRETLARSNGRKRRLGRLAAALRIPAACIEPLVRPHYPFIEYIFHTLALHRGLSVQIADELDGIKWDRVWQPEELQVGKLYHPVKAIDRHPELRRRLQPGGEGR